MPRINRFRIVNFRYDNDKKYIANEIFNFNCKNSLMNLENGGGKSVILQLALQVLKPNCELSTRKFVDYFKVNSSTVHIMIEWLLDTNRTEYLLTGICASRETEGLKFFTYTHAYYDENQCDIKNIQAVNSENGVMVYSEFYKYIKATQGLRINTYTRDRMKEYKEKLAQSNLFENEFEAIRVINQSEGGIEKFFETSKKSRNVIEKLIIPAIPTVGETQNLLAESFKKHMDNLKSIPVLNRNIEIYDLFMERSKELLKNLDDYGNMVNKSHFLNREIMVLENLLYILVSRYDEEIKRYTDDGQTMENALAELEFKKESLVYFLDNSKREELIRSLEKEKQRVGKTEIKIAEIDKELKFCNGVNKHFSLLEYNSKIQANKARLEAIDLDEREIEAKVQELLNHLKTLLDNEIVELRYKIDTSSMDKEVETKKFTYNLNKLEMVTKNKEKISNDLAVTEHKLKNLDDLQKKYYSMFSHDMTLILDPVKSLEDFHNNKKSKIEIREKTIELKASLVKQQEDVTIRLGNINTKKASMTERLKNKQEEYHVFCQKQNSLNQSLNAAGVFGKIYDCRVDEVLKGMIDKAGYAITSLLGLWHGMEKQRLLVEGCDYFIPEEYIKTVNGFLEENNISCTPGALWLKNQQDDRREELLALNPMLPYSIVVEATHMEKVRVLSLKLSTLIDNYPLSIISSDDKGIKFGEDGIKINTASFLSAIDKREVYILRSDKSGIFTNDEEFKAFVGSLDKRMEKATEELEVLKNDQEAIISLRNRVLEFVGEYDQKHEKTIEEEIETLNKGILELEEQHEKAFGELEDIKKKSYDTVEKIEGLCKEIAKLDEAILAMNALIKTIEELKLAQNDEHRLKAELQKIIETILELTKIKDESQAKLENYTTCLKNLTRDEAEFRKRLSEIKNILKTAVNNNELTFDIDETEARLKVLEEKRNPTERNSIIETINILEIEVMKLDKEIQKLGFLRDDFKQQREPIPENEIIDKEEKLEKERVNLKTHQNSYAHIDGEFNNINGRVSTLKENIVKKYNREPYDFTDELVIEREYFEAAIKEYTQKLKQLRVKISDIQRKKFDADKNLSIVKEFIGDKKIIVPNNMMGDMQKLDGFGESIEICDIVKQDNKETAILIKRYKQEYEKAWNKLDDARRNIEKGFENLYKDSVWDENNTVKQVLSNIMKGNLFNIEYMQDLFKKLFQSVEKLKAACVLQLEESMKNKHELVMRCLQRANAVYEEIRMVDNFSKIKINGENTKTIKIEMPKWDEDQGKPLMTLYLESCIDDMKRLMENGSYDPAKIDNTIIGYMSPQALLDAVIGLNNINIKVYKPEHSIEFSGYIPWEVVIKWSGGEKLAGFFAMFISIISYLRYKKTGYMESSKVIWIDNPFGQANAGHILKYIFELANATNTQMICLTGLQETNIYAQFDVVYSLVHRFLSNMSIIQSKAVKSIQGIETGRYSVNSGQMSLFGTE